MPVIKRYPNRKLYNTEAKRYITLDGIAELIRAGEDIQVVDHTTDEDLTAVTLTQIIFEQEKKKGGFLPTSVLTGLVKAGGDTVNSLRRTLSSPLDLLRQVDEEIEKRLQGLISRGELALEEGMRLRDKLLPSDKRKKESDDSHSRLEQLLNARSIPSQAEIANLHQQIDVLSEKIESLLTEKEANK